MYSSRYTIHVRSKCPYTILSERNTYELKECSNRIVFHCPTGTYVIAGSVSSIARNAIPLVTTRSSTWLGTRRSRSISLRRTTRVSRGLERARYRGGSSDSEVTQRPRSIWLMLPIEFRCDGVFPPSNSSISYGTNRVHWSCRTTSLMNVWGDASKIEASLLTFLLCWSENTWHTLSSALYQSHSWWDEEVSEVDANSRHSNLLVIWRAAQPFRYLCQWACKYRCCQCARLKWP